MVNLTEQGLEYREACIAAINILEQAEIKIQAEEELPGKIKVSTPAALPDFKLLKLIQGFIELNPRVSVEVIATDEAQDFTRDSIDLAIRGKSPQDQNIVARAIDAISCIVVKHPDVNFDPLRTPRLDPLLISPLPRSMENSMLIET